MDYKQRRADYTTRISVMRKTRSLFVSITCVLVLGIGTRVLADTGILTEDFSQVLTPTRLQQRISDVPASVTIISREMIRRVGARTVPEILRLVPGMIVGQASGNEWRINYHGTNALAPRRMQVLIDGVSVYHAGLAEVSWSVLPVSIQDIARIEVTRSPSAATYGANSFSGVINIITNHPDDTRGAVAQVTAGALSTQDAYASVGGGFGATSMRLSYSHQQDTGFDLNRAGHERRDNTQLNRVGYKSSTIIDNRTSFGLDAAFIAASLQREFADRNQVTFPDERTNNSFIAANWSRHYDNHHLQVKAYSRRDYRYRGWRSCYPTIMFSPELRALNASNPGYAAMLLAGKVPTGGNAGDEALLADVLTRMRELGTGALSPMCGDTSEDQTESQTNLELQDAWVISNQWRALIGGGVHHDRYSSLTFVNGSLNHKSYRLFGAVEYKPTDVITVNIGGMWEHSAYRTDGLDYSPRAALNYHINTYNTLRFIYATATRTPDALETSRDWNYYASNLSPLYNGRSDGVFFYNARANRSLYPEKITSKEISYYLNMSNIDLAMDVKLYEETLTDLISEKLQFFDYYPTNNGRAVIRGGELQIEHRPTRHLATWLTYAYIVSSSNNYYERSLNARHSGSAVLTYNWPNKWTTTLSYVGNSILGGLTAYGRTDFIVAKEILGDGQRLEASLRLSRLDNTANQFVVSQTTSVDNNYLDRYQLYGSLRLSFF